MLEDRAARKAVLVSIYPQGGEGECLASLAELARLLDTAGGQMAGMLTQMRPAVDSRFGIGSGKIRELSDICKNTGAQLVVFDFELTPSQIRAIEDEMETEVSVIDRSILILDIFASRASSAEGRLQVELAQLKYTAPRLMGKGKDLSRLGGGIGTRGPGESKLEIDRRRLKTRILHLEEELRRVEKNRGIIRSARERTGICQCALVGYTNSGKSALMNRLLEISEKEEKTVDSKDMLFATLDAQHRRISFKQGKEFILIDTVGFVSKLPHGLVEAFKSTLEEVRYADVLIHVVDNSYENRDFHIETTDRVLEQLGAGNKKKIMVYNKMDLEPEEPVDIGGSRVVCVSAKTGYNMERLMDAIEEALFGDRKECGMLVPYDRGDIISYLHENSEILSTEYRQDGTFLRGRFSIEDIEKFKSLVL